MAEDRIDSSDEDEYMEERQGTCYHSCHLPTHDFECLKPISTVNLHCQSHFSSLINATYPFPSSHSLDCKPDLLHDVFPLHETSSPRSGNNDAAATVTKKDIIIDNGNKLDDLNLSELRQDALKAISCKCGGIHDYNRRQSISTSTTLDDGGGTGVGGGLGAILKCHVNKSKNKRRERDRLSKSCVAQ